MPRVMTYNLKGLHLDVGALADVVRAARPDILAVQEPPRGPRRARRLRALADATGLRVVVGGYASRTTALLVADHLAVAVDDARGVRLRWWGTRSRMRSFTRRGYATASVGGVRVVVVHLSLDPVERARHLARVLAEVGRRDAGSACLVLGDVNELPGGPVWDRLGVPLRDAAAGHPEPSFPAWEPHERIDALFVDPSTSVRTIGVVRTDAARRASDHLPLVADLDLATGPGPAPGRWPG